MKNNLQKSNRKNAGFTLLELVVVVAVMGLISSMAMDVYTDSSNQKRFEATKSRLAEIKFAIIGDPMMRVGSEPALTGFFYNMDRLPVNINELIIDPADTNHCVDITGSETSEIDEITCEAITDNVWESKWQGPYLHHLQSFVEDHGTVDRVDDVTVLVFSDAWGNYDYSDLYNFGWDFELDSSSGDLAITSKGLDRAEGGVNFEIDQFIKVYQTELDIITEWQAVADPEYCIDTSTSAILTLYLTSSACIAAGTAASTTYIWVTFP
jgi:prepilin-type N-terminal cleavage/methylation domain-containing protein